MLELTAQADAIAMFKIAANNRDVGSLFRQQFLNFICFGADRHKLEARIDAFVGREHQSRGWISPNDHQPCIDRSGADADMAGSSSGD